MSHKLANPHLTFWLAACKGHGIHKASLVNHSSLCHPSIVPHGLSGCNINDQFLFCVIKFIMLCCYWTVIERYDHLSGIICAWRSFPDSNSEYVWYRFDSMVLLRSPDTGGRSLSNTMLKWKCLDRKIYKKKKKKKTKGYLFSSGNLCDY